ncbi:MAG: hypothetical protein Q7U98_11625 [Methylicorpusculum sp.]|uniref:hypothetical protein n=1 Tax=Methylicorpusculum sp. TaxID=2713644 RepID=UPI0027282271|nr:hypothetical protein [Methylicorpusculum sp.]MDO8939797.1 hypothetical protein [Methylicorpusculum sp.]MDP2202461.1 hypothetical protein [Methylicorpusculum sp.]
MRPDMPGHQRRPGLNLIFRRWLFITLAILQLVSPLLHAHTSSAEPASGLHLPGLEQFSFFSEAPLSDALPDHAGDELPIVIDFGLNSSSPGQHDVQALITATFVFLTYTAVFCYTINLSAHAKPAHRAFLTPHSPRAPPTYL